ncbi:hypothetical protein AWB69_01721 [Caballeronia udeis]|uniref:Uncharacterized protein n=1 Tax=Caballeronia udeis TaxID=1232866 RepID=A0A158FWP6_9BURK|nr:hypothetical protein AWB69_01721 [Caballeronia udeis]
MPCHASRRLRVDQGSLPQEIAASANKKTALIAERGFCIRRARNALCIYGYWAWSFLGFGGVCTLLYWNSGVSFSASFVAPAR